MKMKILSILLITLALGGCTQIAIKGGWGSMEHMLPCNQKLINVAWKGETADLWFLTRPMDKLGEAPVTYRFKAKSTFGLLEGEVIIRESLCD